MRVPSVRLLLDVFIGQYSLKRAAMQIQIQHIRGSKGWRGKRADKQFVDRAITLDTNCRRRGCRIMSGHYQAHLRASWRQRDGGAIVKRAGHAAFWMGAHLVWSPQQSRLHDDKTRAGG